MAGAKVVAEHDMGWLVKAARQMMRPVARLLVGKLSCNVAVSLLKEAYVDEARRRLLAEDSKRRVTQSVLALTTGLDTRQVTSLQEEERRQSYATADLGPEAALLKAWYREDAFKDSRTGEPAVLPIYGRGATFQTLVSRHAGRNVTCPTVLDRLAASGNLEVVNENQVRMISPHYVPVTKAEQAAIERGSASMNRLGLTIAHNLETDDKASKWLQQDRTLSRIPADQVEPLRRKIDEQVSAQIEKLESELDSAEAPGRGDANMAVGLGWFYWEDGDNRS